MIYIYGVVAGVFSRVCLSKRKKIIREGRKAETQESGIMAEQENEGNAGNMVSKSSLNLRQ